MAEATITAEEFERGYAERSGRTIEELRKRRVVRPCDCDYEGCQGWQMVPTIYADEFDREHAGIADDEETSTCCGAPVVVICGAGHSSAYRCTACGGECGVAAY